MVFGYARVSTEEQSINLQLDALLKAGVDEKNIYIDKVSGVRSERKNLSRILKKMREGIHWLYGNWIDWLEVLSTLQS